MFPEEIVGKKNEWKSEVTGRNSAVWYFREQEKEQNNFAFVWL